MYFFLNVGCCLLGMVVVGMLFQTACTTYEPFICRGRNAGKANVAQPCRTFVGKWFCIRQHGAAPSSTKQHKAAPRSTEQQSVGAISSSGNIATSTLEIGPTSTSALGNIINAITNTREGKV